MKTINIRRIKSDECTIGFGEFCGFNFVTLELPWRDNRPNVSCIYPGLYKAKKYFSPSLNREVILLEDRAGRTWIEIHNGNFTYQIKGCILVGEFVGFVNNDSIPDVTNSEKTLDKLLSMLPDEFEISII